VNDDETSNELRLAQSELLTEDTMLRRVQGAMSYKFRIRLDVNNVVNGNTQG